MGPLRLSPLDFGLYLEVHGTYWPMITVLITVLITLPITILGYLNHGLRGSFCPEGTMGFEQPQVIGFSV